MVKSDSSGSKGLTAYIGLCYRCCALEQGIKDPHSTEPNNLHVRAARFYWKLFKDIITSHDYGPDYTLH